MTISASRPVPLSIILNGPVSISLTIYSSSINFLHLRISLDLLPFTYQFPPRRVSYNPNFWIRFRLPNHDLVLFPFRICLDRPVYPLSMGCFQVLPGMYSLSSPTSARAKANTLITLSPSMILLGSLKPATLGTRKCCMIS